MKRKYNAFLFLTLSVIASLVLLPYVLTNTPFLIGADATMQNVQFFEELKTMIANGNIFYDFAAFLGNNFYSYKLFLNFDVFDYVFAWLNFDYLDSILISTYLRMIVGGFSFFLLAKSYTKRQGYAFVFALAYVFSSWGMFNIKDPFLFSFYCFVPLYFLGLEKLIKNKRFLVFIATTAYLAIDNYYMFFTVSLFTPIYYLYRYYIVKGSMKGWMRHCVGAVGYYTIGLLISMVALLPSMLHIAQNTRIGDMGNTLLFDNLKGYIQIFLGLFNYSGAIGNHAGDYTSALVFNSQLDRTIVYLTIWCGSLSLVTFFQSLSKKSKNFQVRRVLVLVLLGMLVIPFFSSIMHGLSAHNFRWSFLVVIMVLLLSLEWIEENLELDIKQVAFPAVLYIISIIIMTPFIASYIGIVVAIQEFLLLIVSFITFMIIVILLKCKKEKILIGAVMLELMLISCYSVFGNPIFREISNDTFE